MNVHASSKRITALLVVAGLALLAAPVVVEQPILLKLAQVLIFALAISGLNLVAGYGGQLSLGHSAFLGLGAYTTTILVTDHGVPVLLTLPIAAVIGFAVGIVAGLPALRLSGHYLALVTLGFAVAFPLLVLKAEGLTGGANGKLLLSQWALPVDGPEWLTQLSVTYLVVLLVTAAGVALMWNLARFGATRILVSQHENPLAASVNGVNLTREKSISFAVSAAITAVAGSLYALTNGVVAPEVFGLMLSIHLVTGLLVGGSATLLGPLVGGVVLVVFPEVAFEVAGGSGANMFYGAVLIIIMFLLPGGIVGGLKRLLGRTGRRAAGSADGSALVQGPEPESPQERTHLDTLPRVSAANHPGGQS
jgi:branched-chain amino acid transport system permease protein